MKLPYKIGTIVRIIVDHPEGIESTNVRDLIGVVASVNTSVPDDPDYEVRTRSTSYFYGETQIVPATANEVREELADLLL